MSRRLEIFAVTAKRPLLPSPFLIIPLREAIIPQQNFPGPPIPTTPSSAHEKPKEVFMPWYVYLLRLQSGCIYVGCTSDLDRRLAEHCGGSGSKITSESSTVELIYSESFADRSCALKREQQLKRWRRAKKLALAAGRLADLRRLAKAHTSCDL
jgi:putative endonuclease